MFRSIAILELFLAAFCFSSETPSELTQLSIPAVIRRGDLPALKRLLSSESSLNSRDASGSTPLMVAVICGNEKITSYLLGRHAELDIRQSPAGVSPNTLLPNGSTALSYAVTLGRTDLVRDLLAAGARTDLRFSSQRTVVHLAAENSKPDIVALLAEHYADLNAVDQHGNTPLDEAIIHVRPEIVSALVEKGADVRRLHPDGRGPVHIACIKGGAAVIPLLVAAGADAVALDNSGQTPLDLALDYKNQDSAGALYRLSRLQPPLQATFASAMERSVQRGRTETALMLLKTGWDPNQPTRTGSTYLNEASLRGHAKMVKLLLDHGARVEVRNSTGEAPLHDAALSGDLETITLLLDHGASIDVRDSESGATPLMLAASLAKLPAVSLLLRRGANPKLKDNAGRTALSRALESHNADLVQLLKLQGRAPIPEPQKS
jgi:uncharacterized protein